MNRIISFCIALLFFLGNSNSIAQKSNFKIIKKSVEELPSIVKFENTSEASEKVQLEDFLYQILQVNPNDELKETLSSNDEIGYKHTDYQQYYKGVKVEHGRYKFHFKEGALKMANGEFYKVQIPSVIPTFSSNDALTTLQSKINTGNSLQQIEALSAASIDSLSFGEMVIYPIFNELKNSFKYRLTYKFDMFTVEPIDRAYYFIDAMNGEVVGVESLMCSSNAETRYSGNREIVTEETPDGFRLYDNTRGDGIHILNNHRNYYEHHALSTDYFDQDDNWTAGEWANSRQDQVAIDAFWGLEMTHDYFNHKHSRNSYDGSGAFITGYTDVHFNISNTLNNAYWVGSYIVFGYGDNEAYTPLTSIDICAHELGHGICQHSANLVYNNESGAMNEGFSDIWGACVEYYAAPEKERWKMGEDVRITLDGLRDLSSPSTTPNFDFDFVSVDFYPDTYKGNNWIFDPTEDSGGVHTNSQVLGHWFYLLTEGSENTDEINDNGDIFSVIGIGIEKAEKIAYRMETVYLTSNSVYEDAREFGIQSAIDLYGECSDEHKATQNAFYAVGLGEKYCKPRSAEQEIWFKRVRSINYGSIVYNNSSGPSSYSDYSNSCIPSYGNNKQTISFLINEKKQYLAIWFDANGDGIFENDSPELVFNEQISGLHQIFRLIDITGQMANETGLMRAKISTDPIDNPCDDIAVGETEDYIICNDDYCESQTPTNLHVENGVLKWDPIPGVSGYVITSYNGTDGPVPPCNCEYSVELSDVEVEVNEWVVPEEIQQGCFLWSVRAKCSDELYSEYSNYACYNENDFANDEGIYENASFGSGNNLEKASSITINPNPALESINISSNEIEVFEKVVHIIDVSGRILKTINAFESKASIDISNLASGVYFIKFENQRTEILKFIKQ